MKEIADLVAEHPFVDGLDDKIIATISGCGRNVSFRPDQTIFREGEAADEFYLLRSGVVALEMFAPGQGAFTFTTLRQGQLLGVSWLVPPYRWVFDARAVELTRAIAFDAKCLRDKCDADPVMGYALMKRFITPLSERLHAARIQGADLFEAASKRRSAPSTGSQATSTT